MLSLCFWVLSASAFAQVSISRTNSLSYENYLQMLDEEAKIPLSEIQEEENPEHLKERMALYRKGEPITGGVWEWSGRMNTLPCMRLT